MLPELFRCTKHRPRFENEERAANLQRLIVDLICGSRLARAFRGVLADQFGPLVDRRIGIVGTRIDRIRGSRKVNDLLFDEYRTIEP
jgi:hypothetical protein